MKIQIYLLLITVLYSIRSIYQEIARARRDKVLGESVSIHNRSTVSERRFTTELEAGTDLYPSMLMRMKEAHSVDPCVDNDRVKGNTDSYNGKIFNALHGIPF